MNTEVKQAIMDKIKEYRRIIITRHFRPDGDAVGSTLGLGGILKESFPDKEVYVSNDDYSDYVAFLGEEDGHLEDDMYREALVIVLDSGTLKRVSNRQHSLAREIIKIDHHVDVEKYGSLQWVEEHRSSACEMIVDFYLSFKDELKITKDAATCLYAGMATDSGRFRYSDTSGDTLRCGAALLDVGIDTETLFARLYLEDYDYLKYQAYAFRRMKMTPNGVAYLYVDKKMQKKFSLTPEQASNSVGIISEIKGSIIWLAFIDNADGSIRVRLRSRFAEVIGLAEKYGGGGHACASGATVYSHKEMKELLKDADDLIREFKANNFYL